MLQLRGAQWDVERADPRRAFILLQSDKEQHFVTAARHEAPGVAKHDNVSPAAIALVQKEKRVLLVENAIGDVRDAHDAQKTYYFSGTDQHLFLVCSLGFATMIT